jgi:hypothetical protein
MSLSRYIFNITTFLVLCVYFIVFCALDEQDFVFLNPKHVIINSAQDTESDLSNQSCFNVENLFYVGLEWYDFKINKTAFAQCPIESPITTIPFVNSSHINRAPPSQL